MAGQLIRMKLRIMWNTVRSQTAVLIFSIIGILYGLGFTGFAYFGIAKGIRHAARTCDFHGLDHLPGDHGIDG